MIVKETRYRKGRRYQKTTQDRGNFLWDCGGWALVMEIAVIPLSLMMYSVWG